MSGKHYTRKVRRADGRVVGELRGDTLRKHVKATHMLHTPRGWAWDSEIIAQAQRMGATRTELVGEDGTKYLAPLSDFWEHGVPLSRGYGKQVCLPLAYWQVVKPGDARQLALFGGVP